jgi:lysine-N-methylase
MLGPGELERLRALDWNGSAPDLLGIAPAEPRGRRTALARRPDGACIYLGSDNQCRIHGQFGEAAKPLMCRLYPFGFAAVGGRIAVDVSFSCRAVSEGLGEPLSRRTPEWLRLLEESSLGETRHAFSKKYSISGELLWELEHQLVALLSDESLSLLDRVRATFDFNRLATTSDPGTEAARVLREAIAKGLPKQIRERPFVPGEERMDQTGRAVFFHLLYLTVNPTPDEILALPAGAKVKEAARRVQAADGYRFEGAHPFLDNRESSATFREVERISAGPLLSGPSAEQLARYLKAKILGQRFLQEGEASIPFVEAVPRLLLQVPIAVWTAKALAAERGAPSVAGEDLRRALRLVDRSYGQIPLAALPPKARKAWRFVLLETDLPVTASVEMLGL